MTLCEEILLVKGKFEYLRLNIFNITPGQMITEALENATTQVAIKNLLVASGVFTMKVRMYLSSRDVCNYNLKN